MIIKLYKNCILTDAYSEVFDVYHKDANKETSLDRYLKTLPQKVIFTPNTYVTNSGKISFDLIDENDTEFYDFNYMSIHDGTNKFIRYCFIDAITVVNGIAVVSYVEDVWSNYAPSLQMRKSLLTRSRIIDYGSYKIPFYSLGMEYQGNNQLKLVELFEKAQQYQQVGIILQVQLYKLTTQGTVSDREIYEFFVSSKIQKQDNYISYRPVASADNVLFNIIKKSSSTKITWNNEEWNYEVYNAIYVPETFNIPLNASQGTPIKIYTEGDVDFYFVVFPASMLGSLEIQYTQQKTIVSNFKQFKVGTILNAYDIIQNGSNIEIKIGYFASKTDFGLYLSFQNQILDITKDFMREFPITVQTADVTQQQATARELSQLNAKLGIASGAMQIGSAMNDIAMGASKVAFGGYTGQLGSVLKGAEQISNAPFEAGRGIINIISSNKHLDIANRALYVSNKGTKLLSNAALCANYGIVLYEIQPDNEVEVQANIDNCGYVCNEIVDNLFNTITTGTTNKWNVMQFDYVNIYGKFTQRIADVLRDILNAGFKIWYDETAINE